MINEQLKMENNDAAAPTITGRKPGVLARIATFLFGNDVFISYSRADASAYALALASELTKEKLTCYLDQWNAPPGVEIPATVKTALKRSSMLVLVGTREAAASPAVGEEVREFLKTGRPILPISFEDSLTDAVWFPSIRGLARTEEIPEAIAKESPSQRVITRVVNAEGFTRRDKRLRRIFLFTAIGIVLLVLAGVIIGWRFRSDAQKQQKLSAANLLSSKAFNLQASQPDLALLLSLESYRIANAVNPDLTMEAKSGLFELLLRTQKISSFLHNDNGEKEGDYCVAFSPDGKKVATGNVNGTVSVWDVHSKKLLPPPAIPKQSTITSLAFSRDGKLATGTGDGSITIWDEGSQKSSKIESEQIASPNSEIDYGISALAFSPDSKTLVIGRCAREDEREERDGGGVCLGAELLFLDLTSEQPKFSFLATQHRSAPTSLTYSPDGKILVSSSNESISFWDSSTRKLIKQVPGQSNVRVQNVAFGKDNKEIAAGVRGDSIIVWDLKTDQPLAAPLTGHDGLIGGVALSPDGVMVASVGGDMNTILWDTNSYGVGQVFLTNTRTDTVAVSPDGKFLATGTGGILNVWDIHEKKLFMPSLKGHTSIQRSIAFSPDSKLMASPAADGRIILWDLTTQQQVSPILDGKHGFVWQVTFSPNGKTLASANDDGTVSLWDLASLKESSQLGNFGAPVYRVAYSPNGNLAIGTQRGDVVIHDLAKPDQVKLPIPQQKMIMGIAFSPDPDGNKLAVSYSDGAQNKIMLWDVHSRTLLRPTLTVNDDFGGGLAFNKDGSLITWVDTRGKVKLWHVGTGQLFARIPAGDVGIDQNVISTNDGQLVTYDRNGAILFWDWNFTSWISRACRIANRSLTSNERDEYSVQLQGKDLCQQ